MAKTTLFMVFNKDKQGAERAINGIGSGRRWKEGRLLEGTRMIPSKSSFPLDSQRRFRGLIIIGLIASILLGILLAVVLFNRLTNRSIIIAPLTGGAAASSSSPVSNEMLSHWISHMTMRMETWTYGNADAIGEDLKEYFHPSLQDALIAQYKDLQRSATVTWEHRVCSPLGTLWGGEHDGIYSMAVVFESLQIIGGSERKDKKISQVESFIAMYEVTRTVQTKTNPYGLQILRRERMKRDEWIRLGRPDFWKNFLMTKEQREKKK